MLLHKSLTKFTAFTFFRKQQKKVNGQSALSKLCFCFGSVYLTSFSRIFQIQLSCLAHTNDLSKSTLTIGQSNANFKYQKPIRLMHKKKSERYFHQHIGNWALIFCQFALFLLFIFIVLNVFSFLPLLSDRFL